MHLAEPKSAEEGGGEILKIGGCRVPMPAKPLLSWWRAVEAGELPRVEALLSEGKEEVNQLGGAYGSTALGWAALAADEPLLEALLARGGDANLKARKGSAPLHMAVWNGDHPSIVRKLLDAGASASAKNHDGKTPLELAKWFDALEEASAAPGVVDLDGWRASWGLPPAGRKGVVAVLEAAATGAEGGGKEGGGGAVGAGAVASGGGEVAEPAVSGAEESAGPRGRGARGRARADDDEEEEEDGDGEGGVRAISAEDGAPMPE